MAFIDQILKKLADLIRHGKFEELETDGLEIKPVPGDNASWAKIHQSVCAFLNTRGGIVIFGVKEEGTGPTRRYVVSGWQDQAEPKIKEIATLFTDRSGIAHNLADCFRPPEIRAFEGARVALLFVAEMPADRKFAFYKGTAYKRLLTGDHKISEPELDAQQAFQEEANLARELRPVPGLTEANLDLVKLNQFIFQLNQPVLVETVKSDLAAARPFLERRRFIVDGTVTILGALVCAQHPGDCLGFRAHLHGYVDGPPAAEGGRTPTAVVLDKQDYVDNVIQLMEAGVGYVQRNIQMGVSAADGGTGLPQYPESLIRESVNNALAHRDYGIDRQVIIAISPGKHIAIRNPGTFRNALVIEAAEDEIPLRRLLPEAKPRNPKLADVLRVYHKWEGRGIGMATLVNLCLQNLMDLPYYRLFSEEVCLYLQPGRLLDERMERLFASFDRHLQARLLGNVPTLEQKLVLCYLLKSEWANESLEYTILLTPDNNHFRALLELEKAGLIAKHQRSSANYPIYVVDRVLARRDYRSELVGVFGGDFDTLDPWFKKVLNVVYRFNSFSIAGAVSAKQASYTLWYEGGHDPGGIEAFDAFYRKIRRIFNKLEKEGMVAKKPGTRGYVLNANWQQTKLF